MENKIIVNYENAKPFAIVTINDVTERVPVRVGHANRTTANGPELWIQLEKHSESSRKWLTTHVQPGNVHEITDFKLESGRVAQNSVKLEKPDEKLMKYMSDEQKTKYLELIDAINAKRQALKAAKVENALASLEQMLAD